METKAILHLSVLNMSGGWSEPEVLEREEFIAKYRGGMWTQEVAIVNGLAVGGSYWGGGGATPEWRVVRVA